MKKLMWMVACVLLAMAVPMVQGCSDDDDDQDNQSVPTTPEDILKFIQGDWRADIMDEDGEKNVARVTKDTIVLYGIDEGMKKTVYEESHILSIANGKLSWIDPKGNIDENIVISVEKNGRIKITMGNYEIFAHRENFKLYPRTLECWGEVLEGQWKVTKLIDRGKVETYPDQNGDVYLMLFFRPSGKNEYCDVETLFGPEEGPWDSNSTEKFKIIVEEDGTAYMKNDSYTFVVKKTGMNSLKFIDTKINGDEINLIRDEDFSGFC